MQEYMVVTEDGGDQYFRIYAKAIIGDDCFVMRYRSLNDFLEDWEDID